MQTQTLATVQDPPRIDAPIDTPLPNEPPRAKRPYRHRDPERARAKRRESYRRAKETKRRYTRAARFAGKAFDASTLETFDDFNQRIAAAIIFFALADAKTGDFTARLFFDSPWFTTLATGLELDPEMMRDQLLALAD